MGFMYRNYICSIFSASAYIVILTQSDIRNELILMVVDTILIANPGNATMLLHLKAGFELTKETRYNEFCHFRSLTQEL